MAIYRRKSWAIPATTRASPSTWVRRASRRYQALSPLRGGRTWTTGCPGMPWPRARGVSMGRGRLLSPVIKGATKSRSQERTRRERSSPRGVVIGADGALSMVRKFIRPDLKVRYRPAYRECYREDFSIPKDRFHWFFPFVSPSPRFDVSYKGGFFLIEGGNIRRLKENIKESPAGLRLPPRCETAVAGRLRGSRPVRCAPGGLFSPCQGECRAGGGCRGHALALHARGDRICPEKRGFGGRVRDRGHSGRRHGRRALSEKGAGGHWRC